MGKMIPKTRRGLEWKIFSEKVLTHIDNYTVPQYGDMGEDEIDNWTKEDCILAIKKYLARSGRNSRKGQNELDMLKIAHYACFVYNKLGEENKDDMQEL